jgi:protein SCO1/2
MTAVLIAALLASGSAPVPAPRNPQHLPNPVLTTEQGKKVHFFDDLVEGRNVVIQFMYTRCDGICPATTGNLLRVHRALADRIGRDLFIVSISLDPERDSPAALARHAAQLGNKRGWTFVTGRRADLEALRKRLGARDPDPVVDADRTQHSGLLVVGNERLDRWCMISGLSPPSAIVRSIENVIGRPPAAAPNRP